MKRKNKLPKYWLGTAKPLSMGYQQNRGVGDTFTSTTIGQSIQPEVNAIRRSQVPNAISKFASASQYPLQMIANYTPALLSNTAANAFKTAGQTMSTIGTTPIQQGIGRALSKVGSKAGHGALNAFGTAAGIAGAGYSAYNIYNDIANADEHRSAGQMLDTRGVDTITTAEGNTYKQYGAIDAGAERAYERQQRTGKQVGLALDAAGLGASIGGFFGPLGMGIGAAGGLLVGGIADLAGYGNNEDEVQEAIDLATAQTARQNRQSRSVAEDADVKSQFANRAANGKRPVWTPAGLVNKKATARVSNGEVIGNFEDGLVTRVSGHKNNKDTKLANLKNGDFVISNKYGLSDYAAATGDYAGALNLQERIMGMRNSKGYKCGKLPKLANGMWDTVFSMIPHGVSLASNLSQYNRAKEASVKASDTYADNAEGNAALNVMAGLRYDPRPYYEQAGDTLREANWQTARQPGLGMGARAFMQGNNFNNYLQNLMKVNWAANEATNNYRQSYAKMLAEQGARNQQLRMTSSAQRHQWMQQANAARENWMAQYLKNLDTNLLNMASEYMKWGQYNDTKDIQNKQLSLWDRQTSAEEDKINALIANLGNNTSSNNTNLLKTYDFLRNMSFIPQFGFFKHA